MQSSDPKVRSNIGRVRGLGRSILQPNAYLGFLITFLRQNLAVAVKPIHPMQDETRWDEAQANIDRNQCLISPVNAQSGTI